MKDVVKTKKKTPKMLKLGKSYVIILLKENTEKLQKIRQVLIEESDSGKKGVDKPARVVEVKDMPSVLDKIDDTVNLTDASDVDFEHPIDSEDIEKPNAHFAQKKHEIEMRVKEFIAENKIDTSKPVDIVALVRNLGFAVASLDLPETEDGFVIIDEEDDNLFGLESDKVIGVNDSRDFVDQRFIVAHELGHFLLHSKNEPLFAHRENIKGKNQEENDADYFAACILMYDELFVYIYKALENVTDKLEEKVSFLAEYFKVPEQSVRRRIAETIGSNK